MRLLEKREIDQAKARDDQRRIEEGLNLAKRVDRLRELSVETEESYKSYRDAALREIQVEIDQNLAEKEKLIEEVRHLRTERIKAEGPLDFVEEWEVLRKEKEQTNEWKDDLLNREIGLTKRENDVREAQDGFAGREDVIRKVEIATQKAREEAVIAKEQAHVNRTEAEALKASIEELERRTQIALQKKTLDLAIQEKNLLNREEGIAQEKIDITKEKIFLADQRATLERGFAELRRKQNGK